MTPRRPGISRIREISPSMGAQLPSLRRTLPVTLTTLEVPLPSVSDMYCFLFCCDHSIYAGDPWQLTLFVKDQDMPAQHLTYSGLHLPDGARVDSQQGLVSWNPSENDAPSTNLFIIAVTDDGIPALSTTNKFQVIVKKQITEQIAFDQNKLRYTTDGFTMEFNATIGRQCLIEFSEDLKTWHVLKEWTIENNLESFTDRNTFGKKQRYYRVQIR